ncbi:hypothetical protein CC1G_09623 [Coprinopsis cinerea okayama7|uniref:Uncharacterized protein n=1 Tax=Coprinopsis cinerea (strain Okayama-7 / 130 / ATCC MYA-4618 / FGSC 9003) TaxID=240176 RepID=A8N4D9_COPC7|nr:hypothetical protein CC1G_09623 [Coprinopsis cinerea okayama7\|eukprot:XP_001829734.2 hypothetical protein CC1G_09623 [Coprinopsis cinerea okayama7\
MSSNTSDNLHAEPGKAVAGPSDNPGFLQLVLVATDKDNGEDRYALVPFPSTYEDAQRAALSSFSHYMVGDNIPLDKVILRIPSKNKDDEWIWADITPGSWSVLARSAKEVGVFQAGRERALLLDDNRFLAGHCWLALGTFGKGTVSWSAVKRVYDRDGSPGSALIRRPPSYEEAITLLDDLLRDKHLWYELGVPFGRIPSGLGELGREVVFFSFLSEDAGAPFHTSIWQEMPRTAKTDVALWRAWVPSPNSILGVALRDRAE